MDIFSFVREGVRLFGAQALVATVIAVSLFAPLISIRPDLIVFYYQDLDIWYQPVYIQRLFPSACEISRAKTRSHHRSVVGLFFVRFLLLRSRLGSISNVLITADMWISKDVGKISLDH